MFRRTSEIVVASSATSWIPPSRSVRIPSRDRELLDLVVARLPRDQLTHRFGDGQQLVDADPVLEAGAEAEVAALAPPELFLRRTSRPPVELELLVAGPVRHAAVAADPAHEPLPDDADDRRRDQERFDPEIQEPLECAGGVGTVQRGEHEVSRERRLDPDTRRLHIAHLADEDDVGVLAEDRPQTAGERHAGLVLDLDLIDRGEDVLDRVLNRHDVALAVVDLGERRVERRGLAASRRAGADDHPEGSADQPRELVVRLIGHPEIAEPEAATGSCRAAASRTSRPRSSSWLRRGCRAGGRRPRPPSARPGVCVARRCPCRPAP